MPARYCDAARDQVNSNREMPASDAISISIPGNEIFFRDRRRIRVPLSRNEATHKTKRDSEAKCQSLRGMREIFNSQTGIA